jgi:hypothetical protein
MQKALTQMNLQLHHVVSDITGVTGMTIIRAIVAGERDPNVLATHRNRGCHASVETVCQALVGNYREEHVFALTQALELYDVYQAKVTACDVQIEAILKRLKKNATAPASKLLPARHEARSVNAPAFDARAALHAILGVDLTQINGLGPYLTLKLVGECGTNLTAWSTAKHFTSWLGLAPHNKISGTKVLSSKTRRTGNRAASLLRLAAVSVGRTDTALGAFYRRLSARVGKAKAITATVRKIAVLFYNTLRHGMSYVDPGATYYEERYRQRVLGNLQGVRNRWGMSCPKRTKTPPEWLFLRKFRYRRPRHTLKGRQDASEVDRIGLRLQLREQQAEAGDIVLLYDDESEALTHPYLARAWAKMAKVPSAKPMECHRRDNLALICVCRHPDKPKNGYAGLA